MNYNSAAQNTTNINSRSHWDRRLGMAVNRIKNDKSMKAKILFALAALLMLGSVSLNAQEVGNSSNSESTTQLEGDLNHDNKVDVADVTYLVNLIMNQSTSENIPVTGVSVSTSESSINVGNTLQLEVAVEPSSATNKNVTWSSSNPEIATVDEATGLVTGIALGTATIIATSVDGGKTATTRVEVVDQLSDYYWYIGIENPSSISNIQTDNTKPGWHSIGSSLSGFKLDTDENPIILSTVLTDVYMYYIVIPNELNLYDADGASMLYSFNQVECNITGYKAYQYDTPVRRVRGVYIK